MNTQRPDRRFILGTLTLLIVVITGVALSLPAKASMLPSSAVGVASGTPVPMTDDGENALQGEAPIPYHIQPYVIRSGLHAGLAEGDMRSVVEIDGAPWLRVHFGEVNLGSKSQIVVTSLEDGAQQALDAISLQEWGNSSAYFNGDAVSVELNVAAEDEGVFYEIDEVMVGEWATGQPSDGMSSPNIAPDSVCGATDDRTASSNPAVGRIVPVGCTGWIVSNGALLTAGHCNTGSMTTIEFNVPASSSSGTVRHPGPQDQYPIVGMIVSSNGGSGNDWAVFGAGKNAPPAPATPQLPALRQDAFFRLSAGLIPSNVVVTGYGVDGPAPCFGDSRQPGCTSSAPPRNAASQTQQTHSGPSLGLTGTHWEYRVDTEGANSGSPIHVVGDIAVGVHTHGSGSTCPSGPKATPGASNGGTAFNNTALATAIEQFPTQVVGQDVVYVDRGHPSGQTIGTVFSPFRSVTAGVNVVQNNGIVSIVKGTYDETLTISRKMTLTAPVGLVTIGQ